MRQWGKRFLSSTRGQVVELLRRGEATVNELADALDLTDNAVRAHLTTLERDGLVRQAGKRAGIRKPETVYALATDAEQLFPKAYDILLNELLESMGNRMTADELEEVLREAGSNLVSNPSPKAEAGDLEKCGEKAIEAVKSLGGLAEMDGDLVSGLSCPVSSVVKDHPEICRLVESLLSQVVGAPVREQCDRSGTPKCVFKISIEGDK